MTTILGISAFYHDSASELIIDGEIIAAAQEERFTRIKHDAKFPQNAIDYVLKEYPEIINGYHACGPGNTYEALKKVIKDPKHLEIVLSYSSWKKKLL